MRRYDQPAAGASRPAPPGGTAAAALPGADHAPPAIQQIEVTPREEEFLRAAQEWAEAKLSEATAYAQHTAARSAHEEATRERQQAGARLEEAQQALLADYERDELDQREAAP